MTYERYRILVFNEFEKIVEEKFLKQIFMEENCSYIAASLVKAEEAKKKKLSATRAAIGFNYESQSAETAQPCQPMNTRPDDEESSDSDYEPEFDKRLSVAELSSEQWKVLNTIATKYTMKMGDFVKCMWEDYEEQAKLQSLKDIEDERLALAGKQSRRERKMLKEIRLRDRGIVSNPLDILQIKKINEQIQAKYDRRSRKSASSSSRSSSSSSDNRSRSKSRRSGKQAESIEFITTFGGNDDDEDDDDDGDDDRLNIRPIVAAVKRSSVRPRSDSNDKRKERLHDRDNRKSPSQSRNRDRTRYYSSRRRSLDRRRSRSRSITRYRSKSRTPPSRSRSRRSRSGSPHSKRSRSRGCGRKESSHYSKPHHDHQKSIRNGVTSSSKLIEQHSSVPSLKPSATLSDHDESDLSNLSIRSDMSESEQERRQVENTRRRLKRTKRELKLRSTLDHSKVPSISPMENSRSLKQLSALDRLKLQTQKALKKNLAKDKEEERVKKEEIRREQQERDEEIRELALQLRAKERDLSPLRSPFRSQRRSNSSSSDGSRPHDSRRRSKSRSPRR